MAYSIFSKQIRRQDARVCFDAFSITPDDATDLASHAHALNVAVAGTVNVDTVEGTTVSVYVAAGVVFPLAVRRVRATGTTATGIVGLI